MVPRALTWLKEHWRPVALATAVLVAFAAGWAAHRPAPRVEYRDRVVVQEHVVDHVVTRTVTVEAKQKQDEKVVHKVVTRRADGSSVTTVDVASASEVNLQLGQTVAADLSHVQDVTAKRETSLVQTPAAPPRWRVEGLVGLELHGLQPVYGGQVSRRVLGPLWAGAWGLSSGVGGVSVGVEW